MSQKQLEKLEQQKAELERKQKELNAKIKLAKSKQAHEQRKKATHYKVLLGAYVLHTFVERGEFPQVSVEQLRKFINDESKFEELSDFINAEISKGGK